MNSQFQQLAEQAGMYVEVNGKPWPRWMGADECEVAYQKFAELIVRECAQMADFADKNPGDYVLKHFGVEE